MTVTAVPHLRPLGLGKLLDQAIRLYRRNFLTFIGIIAIVQIPLTLIQLVVSLLTFGDFFTRLEDFPTGPAGDSFDLFGPAFFAGAVGSVILAIIGFILIQGVATAALTRAVAGSYLGQSIGITESYRQIGRSWLTLIGALLLAVVLSIALLIWFLVPCVGWLTGGGILAFFWMVIVPLIAPIVVLEEQSAGQAIRRAWDLARRRFWWILGFVFILFIFAQLIVTGPVTLITVLFQLVLGDQFEFSASQAVIQTVVQSLSQLLLSLIYLPLQLTAITLMYFDLRVRTEGFDLTLLSESIAGSPTGISEITAHAPQPETRNLVTMTEMGYFFLITIGVLVLYFVLFSFLGGLFFALAAAGGPGF